MKSHQLPARATADLRLPRKEMACGAVFGLAWASSMRAMMAEVAASDGGSHFSIATFIFLLPPGALLGAVVGWVLTTDRPGLRRAPGWLVWCPVIMCADPAAAPFMLATIGVGWVAGGRGTRKSRLWIGIPSVLFWITLLITALVVPPSMVSSLRDAWTAILLFSLLGSLIIVETMVVNRLNRSSGLAQLHEGLSREPAVRVRNLGAHGASARCD